MNDSSFYAKKNENLLKMEGMANKCLTGKLSMMKFPYELENYFNEFDMPVRAKRFLVIGIIGLFFYNLFMINDKLMLPDIYKTAWFIRALIVTPVTVVALALIKLEVMRREADFFAAVIITMVAGSIMVMMLISNHSDVIHYYTGILIVVTFGNIIVRPRFVYAVLISLTISLMYLFTAFSVSQMNINVISNSCIMLFVNTILTLVGNFYLSIEYRREFLLNLLRRIGSIKLEESNRLLEKLSISDELTGLSNRRHFDLAFAKEWRSCSRNHQPLSVVFIDIDFFKDYNDYYGHQQGDLCLEIIAGGLSKVAQRPGDFVARYGGEEFVIFLSDTDLKNGLSIAENAKRIVEKLQVKHGSSPLSSYVTISLGVACVTPSEKINPDDLILFADRALYMAKNQGRNRVSEYSEELYAEYV